MVSLNSVSHLKFILTFSLLLLFSYNAYAAIGGNLKPTWLCIIGQTKCCVNGTRSCCPDNGTIYDTTSCSCTEGTKQYKPKGSCGTSIQTCCSDGTWSGWDSSCPVSKTCSSSTKPSTRTTCNGGYKYRTVTCNTSTGEWQTGSWGDCDCSDPAYEKVTLRGGGTCCQRKDGTGLRCATDGEIPYGWVKMGTPCWNKIDCGTSPLPECNESLSGTYWSKWETSGGMVSTGCGSQYGHINGAGFCQQYLCRQGG